MDTEVLPLTFADRNNDRNVENVKNVYVCFRNFEAVASFQN